MLQGALEDGCVQGQRPSHIQEKLLWKRKLHQITEWWKHVCALAAHGVGGRSDAHGVGTLPNSQRIIVDMFMPELLRCSVHWWKRTSWKKIGMEYLG